MNCLTNQVTELSLIPESQSVGVICVTESHLTNDIQDGEISIPNFDLYREDRAPKSKSGGSAIYVHKDFKVTRLNWFNGSESIALRVNSQSFEIYIVCIYRSPSRRTIEANEILLTQLANIPTDCDKNVVVVGDLNLPNVDWKQGVVIKPENSIDKFLNMQCEFLDLFIAKGFSWFVEDQITRIRKVGNDLQQSTLDQVLSNNDSLINCVKFQSPLGKSDHLGLLLELNITCNLDYISSKKKNWYRVNKEFIHSHGFDIDWSYSSSTISVDTMWNELHQKMLSISDKIPETSVKTDKQGNILEKLPWDSSKLVRKRKEKDQAWKAFEVDPNMTTYQNAHYKQGQYSCVEFKEKIKYEKKIIARVKTNTKPLFRYLKSKNKVRKTVKELERSDGTNSKTPQETADTLLDFFQSVFKSESFGPLPEKCYESSKVLNQVMQELIIDSSNVKKLLLNLKENKAMGPDNIHPKLLKFLAENPNFVSALTLLLNKCVSEECIPTMWKSAVVIPIHKKGSVHLTVN